MGLIVADITENLELQYAIPRALKNSLGQIGIGKRVVVTVKAFKNPRTKKQNAYLWAVVYPMIAKYIKDQTGQEFAPGDLHNRYKKKYLGYETCDIPGMEDIVRLKSSTELDTAEFWDQLVEHICREWAELGLFIPLPVKVGL